jgi:hypothetical protein
LNRARAVGFRVLWMIHGELEQFGEDLTGDGTPRSHVSSLILPSTRRRGPAIARRKKSLTPCCDRC